MSSSFPLPGGPARSWRVVLVLALALLSLPAAEMAFEHFQAGRLPEGLALLPPLAADPPAGQAAARQADRQAALAAALPQSSAGP